MSYLQNLEQQNGLLGNADNLAMQIRQQGMANTQPVRNVRAMMEQQAAQTNAQAQQEQEKKQAVGKMIGGMVLGNLVMPGIVKGVKGLFSGGAKALSGGGAGQALSGAGQALSGATGSAAMEGAGFGQTMGKDLAMKAGDVGHGFIDSAGKIKIGDYGVNPFKPDWKNNAMGLPPVKF